MVIDCRVNIRCMENLDPKKYHSLSPTNRKILITVFVFILLLIPLLGAKFYKYALNRENQGFKETTFEISDGEAVSSVARRLYEEELVNSEFLFKAHMITSGLHTSIQAGLYNIPVGASIYELGELFQHGTNDVQVTFLEGWRAEEFAIEASEKFKKIDYQSFLNLAKEKEGYLFPDTYFFNIETTEEQVIEKLTSTYKNKTSQLLRKKDLDELGLTEEQAIIFASIVEREVSKEDDRKVVAGILINRWKNGELIGADATTQYAVATLHVCANTEIDTKCPNEEEAKLIEWWPSELSKEDLENESPYNTRKVIGLPPAPIANPSLSSIEAVMNYMDTSYNYYLTDENGMTHYAITLEEHNRNVYEYLR